VKRAPPAPIDPAEIPLLVERVADIERLLEVQERVVADQSDKQRALIHRLRQSEANFRALVEQLPDAVYVSRDGVIQYANAATTRLLGYSCEQLLGQRGVDLLVHPDDHAKVRAHKAAAQHGAAAGPLRVRWVRRDGGVVVVEGVTAAITYDDGPAGLIIARDVTDDARREQARLQLEEQLRQTQKMDAIGRLAGGVAHDFNNLLSVILSYTDLVMGELRPEDPLTADLSEVRQAARRAADLTRQLLAFSRKQILEPRAVNLNAVVEDLERMLQRLVGEEVRVETNLDERLGSVFVDRGQIEQVLMNLVVNARDAMPWGGRVVVESGNVQLDEAWAAAHPGAKPGPHVRLTVTDTGHGMSREVQQRIFEPFFTTKEKHKGTGLGLSTVLGIVEQSGGGVLVTSEVGKGTTFEVYLPRTDRAAEVKSSVPPPASRGTEKILLVEDDELVRRTIRVILTRQGYRVLEAQNAGEALMLSEKHAGKIDLLLTDVVMPVINGREVAERLLQARPGMKVLYMSGYTEHAIVHHGVLDAGIAFIPKPVTPAALAQKIREVLAAP
jgi:PAS domain S-box-containing protein